MLPKKSYEHDCKFIKNLWVLEQHMLFIYLTWSGTEMLCSNVISGYIIDRVTKKASESTLTPF